MDNNDNRNRDMAGGGPRADDRPLGAYPSARMWWLPAATPTSTSPAATRRWRHDDPDSGRGDRRAA